MLLSDIHKTAFINLFNRGGYVLDFTNSSFDDFTQKSIGVAVQQKYGLSKGKSLIQYINDANEFEIIKLFSDLMEYYEFSFPERHRDKQEYKSMFESLKPVIEKANKELSTGLLSIEELKSKFSSDYISAQLELMKKMQNENPTEAIGKAKELIESCCKTILEKRNVTIDKNWKISNLIDNTVKELKITPNNVGDITEADTIKAILANLKVIAVNIAKLRNSYGSGHGKSASYKGLETRHAKLAVGSSITLVQFLWDSYERQYKN